jgi:excisionase family DNA binding protein
MNAALAQDIDLLRSGLAGGSAEIEVTLRLPRTAAEKVLTLLDAERDGGAVVILSRDEYTTTQAAALLKMSRPTLMLLINAGLIEHRMVGSHHRIPASAIVAYQERQREMDASPISPIGEWANRVGQFD